MPNIDRKDPLRAKQTIDICLGRYSARDRTILLNLFADSIALAAKRSPAGWGVTLHEDCVRFTAGHVESVILSDTPRILIYTGKPGVYGFAPNCHLVDIVLPGSLNSVNLSAHKKSMEIALEKCPNYPYKSSHSPGVIAFLRESTSRSLADPSYYVELTRPLHLLNGDTAGDELTLRRAASGSTKASTWIVPKGAEIGDDVVIHVFRKGLFCIGRIASPPKPPPRGSRDKRWRAALENLDILPKPIPLTTIIHEIPDLEWARYPRSIHTPTPVVADHLRYLIEDFGAADFDDLSQLTNDELEARLNVPLTKGVVTRWLRKREVREKVLRRAKENCENCNTPGPFKLPTGRRYLETHHTIGRKADTPRNVIALCPNCHRRADLSADKASFNDSLKIKLAQIFASAH